MFGQGKQERGGGLPKSIGYFNFDSDETVRRGMVKNSPLSKTSASSNTKADNNIVLNNNSVPTADRKEKKKCC